MVASHFLMRTQLCGLIGFVACVFAGCASSPRTPVYDSNQVGQVITAQSGEVIGVQDVVIKAPSSRAGSTGVGAQIGSAAAVAAITGNPLNAAMAAGRVVGSVVGAGADNQRGEEITVLLKDGRTIVVVQERGSVPFAIGDRVKVMSGSSGAIYGGGKAQIVRDDAPPPSDPVGMIR